jgi:hypothetical protein
MAKQPVPKRTSNVMGGYEKVQDDFSAAPIGGRATPAKASPKMDTKLPPKGGGGKTTFGSKK